MSNGTKRHEYSEMSMFPSRVRPEAKGLTLRGEVTRRDTGPASLRNRFIARRVSRDYSRGTFAGRESARADSSLSPDPARRPRY